MEFLYSRIKKEKKSPQRNTLKDGFKTTTTTTTKDETTEVTDQGQRVGGGEENVTSFASF